MPYWGTRVGYITYFHRIAESDNLSNGFWVEKGGKKWTGEQLFPSFMNKPRISFTL